MLRKCTVLYCTQPNPSLSSYRVFTPIHYSRSNRPITKAVKNLEQIKERERERVSEKEEKDDIDIFPEHQSIGFRITNKNKKEQKLTPQDTISNFVFKW